jgi:hypothetical protein
MSNEPRIAATVIAAALLLILGFFAIGMVRNWHAFPRASSQLAKPSLNQPSIRSNSS